MAPAELKELKEQLKDLVEKGKANVVADALSHRSMGSLAHVESEKRQLTREIHQLACLGVRLVDSYNGGVVFQNTAKSSLIAEVKERQYEDPKLVKLRERVPQQKKPLLELKGDGVLRYRGHLCVPDVAGLGERIMSEAHYSCYSIHPGSTKMYHDIKDVYWWNDMKKNIVEYVAQCPSCQQMAPYEALYWRKCRSPIGWFDIGESGLHGPDLVQQAIEKVKLIRERLLTTQSRQKSYSDVRRQDLEFVVNDWVFLKVSPMNGVIRFGKKGKLSARCKKPSVAIIDSGHVWQV
ncbi:uncharacterized protein [Nicotiana tomentosiformis]|uniref:uncharacterized protein n=1 Tax=Nicotiana tomentosiformis TaxID=4098 RepID=UPI00388C9B36